MDTTSPTTIDFAGDLSDPWVAGIAQALSNLAVVPCDQQGAGLPRRAFQTRGASRGILILHRSRLTPADVARMEEIRRELGVENWPRIVLCVSPYVRYAEIERCAGLVELVTPEATAAETLPRQIERMLKTPGAASRAAREASPVEVISTDYELRQVLREACMRAGYRTSDSADLLVAPGEGRRLTVWDVPILEPRWEERLERRSRLGPVLALLGFADRAAVTHAREAGASACLDLPCAMEDLVDAVDRMAREASGRPRVQKAHATPPPPSRAARGRIAIAGRPVATE